MEDRFVGRDEREIQLAFLVLDALLLHTPFRNVQDLVHDIASIFQTIGETSVMGGLSQKADKVNSVGRGKIEARIIGVAIDVLNQSASRAYAKCVKAYSHQDQPHRSPYPLPAVSVSASDP